MSVAKLFNGFQSVQFTRENVEKWLHPCESFEFKRFPKQIDVPVPIPNPIPKVPKYNDGDWIIFNDNYQTPIQIIGTDSEYSNYYKLRDQSSASKKSSWIRNTRLATNKEVESYLIQEALTKGFNTGATVKTFGGYTFTSTDSKNFEYSLKDDELCWWGYWKDEPGRCNYVIVYKKGKWIEVLPTEQKEETVTITKKALGVAIRDITYANVDDIWDAIK